MKQTLQNHWRNLKEMFSMYYTCMVILLADSIHHTITGSDGDAGLLSSISITSYDRSDLIHRSKKMYPVLPLFLLRITRKFYINKVFCHF